MNKHSHEFSMQYAYWLEDMHYIFWRRIDACINISLIVLGTAVAATLVIDILVGLFVALLAAINVVIQPLRKALNARTQADKYSQILDNMHQLEDQALKTTLENCYANNSDEIGALAPLAYNQAAICLKLKPISAYKLNNKLAGWFIGNLPESRP